MVAQPLVLDLADGGVGQRWTIGPVAAVNSSPTTPIARKLQATPMPLAALDHPGGHASRVTGGEPVRRVEHREEAVCWGVVVDRHELGDLGAAVAELGAGAARSTIVMPIPKGATSRATDSQNPSILHCVAW